VLFWYCASSVLVLNADILLTAEVEILESRLSELSQRVSRLAKSFDRLRALSV